jgi:hypothetical protein
MSAKKKTIVNGGYAVQALFCEGWSNWRGKNKILQVQWILASLLNTFSLLLVEEPIDHFFKMPMKSAICYVMHIRSSQNKLSGYKLCPFSLVTSMSGKMFLVWKGDGIMFEIALPSLVSWKRCDKNPNFLLEILTNKFIVFF